MDNMQIPDHIAVIMDGNGRWATARGLPRTEGHAAGEQALMRWVYAAKELGVKHITFYTFSTENWKREASEVRFLMQISRRIMKERAPEFLALGAKVQWLGRKNRLWKSVLNELENITRVTKDCTEMTVNFCINYGGRAEITDAVNSIIDEVKQGKTKGNIGEATIQKHLYAPNLPDVDLLIRTSGEQRISNFLLWQIAYSEMIFIDTPWPDVTAQTLKDCITEFNTRRRLFGGKR